jgi:maltose alpha-D-glucosyltransferase/alpha-amylase
VKKLASASDPLWYKDAIIYELHVRAFADSNNDGIGDFQGLISKLDYLQDLGITCLWLLPFFPSPLRDDGYDIANYVDVNPSYGTLGDFKQFLDAAHARNMQVMIELVINHTSDQHPWFQAARTSPPGSAEREMYVWSNDDQLYKDARIIFTDTEKSNWAWDETAKAYYWHRFFSHQPDLNFDNPRVLEEVLNAMRFWLDMGVDALRMDAIPYLLERDDTTCENLPETHLAIKKIRAAIDADYANRLVLAEANQWPADVRPYFGDGDECHMAFHFPLMPRIYMALRQEDRLPITDIMAQTPAIPESCQWGLFLRNHDELTLEMVTADERDYMYLAYSADPRMRINVGIRRRLAPLVDNNRRRIELLNSLLLSFPGTPIMYYGDEIGMGDNIYLGDRNGVRTPMQWNSDRNAGFSKCDPARLYFPVVMDPIYGYQTVNVEMQLSDQSSLLHWTRNMIALRKLFQVFGRGTFEFLHPENRKILAYLRRLKHEDGTIETVLCVANLSRFAQPVELDLSAYAGLVPVEMLGYVSFPAISAKPYPLTLAPYSFLWFELQASQSGETVSTAKQTQPMDESEVVGLALLNQGWETLRSGVGLAFLEQALPPWLMRQRWFGAKTRKIESIRTPKYAILPTGPISSAEQTLPQGSVLAGASSLGNAIFFIEVVDQEGTVETYQLPLALGSGAELETVLANSPQSVIASLATPNGPMALFDATTREEFRQGVLRVIETEANIPLGAVVLGDELAAETITGDAVNLNPRDSDLQVLGGRHSSLFPVAHKSESLMGRVGSAEQSNTSILFGKKMILKLFRKLHPGKNPDIEIGQFLTEVAHFPRIASFLGDITLTSDDGATTAVAMLQELVTNEGDGWSWTMDELARFYESVAGCPLPKDLGELASFLRDGRISEELKEKAGLYLEGAALLGRRTAELHTALATATNDVAFQAEPITKADLQADADSLAEQIAVTMTTLRTAMSSLTDETADRAALLLSQRVQLFASAKAILQQEPSGHRIRIHGDFHLGQVLRAKNDFVLLDFEGEPARPLEDRRQKQCPLKDVAGMLRSFSYAAWAGFEQYIQRHPDRNKTMEPWVRFWQESVSTAFLRAYREASKSERLLPSPQHSDLLLKFYLLEKSLYELLYELNNRPTWVPVPLAGLLAQIYPNVVETSA